MRAAVRAGATVAIDEKVMGCDEQAAADAKVAALPVPRGRETGKRPRKSDAFRILVDIRSESGTCPRGLAARSGSSSIFDEKTDPAGLSGAFSGFSSFRSPRSALRRPTFRPIVRVRRVS
jgi:hypothetical protein